MATNEAENLDNLKALVSAAFEDRSLLAGAEHKQAVLDTLALARGAHAVSTQNFDIVTAFTPEGIAEANALGRSLTDLKAEAMEIDAALRACPDGTAGKACRQQARARMKALNERARQQALGYADRHGLPVGR